jgi:hypothetical protein
VVQALPLLALAATILLVTIVYLFRSQTDSATASITVHPALAGEVRHVAVEMLKVRQGPSPAEPVVALLDRFATVQVMDSTALGEWARILTQSGVTGYVPSRFLFGGTGSGPRTRWCTDQRGGPPENGDVLLRRSGGENRLTVQNKTGQDAVVRLKTPNGQTLIMFFVAANATAQIDGIPDGNFRVAFANGAVYSRPCGIFLGGMQTYIVPATPGFRRFAAKDGTRDLSLILPPIGEGPGQSHPLPPESFLDN